MASPVNTKYEPDRDRTCDPLIKSQLLYQLSYRPVKRRELYVAKMKCQAPGYLIIGGEVVMAQSRYS